MITMDDPTKVETPTPGETPASAETAPVAVEAPKPEPEAPKYTEKELREQLDRVAAATRRDVERREREKLRKLEVERDALKRKAEAGARPMPPNDSAFQREDGTVDAEKLRLARVKYEDDLETWRQAQRAPAPTPSAEPEGLPEDATATFQERAAPLKQKYPDFDQVINAPVFTLEMRDALFDSDQGPEIAYFLGKNKVEADRLAALPHPQMLREIGRLEARFAPNPKAVSAAPPPITPVQGTAGASKDPEKMTTPEWMAWEKQQRLEKLKQNPLGL